MNGEDVWTEPDRDGTRTYVGEWPSSATVLDGHTYIGPRIEATLEREVDGNVVTMKARIQVVCVCGWKSDPLLGALLSDLASLYSIHLQEVSDV